MDETFVWDQGTTQTCHTAARMMSWTVQLNGGIRLEILSWAVAPTDHEMVETMATIQNKPMGEEDNKKPLG